VSSTCCADVDVDVDVDAANEIYQNSGTSENGIAVVASTQNDEDVQVNEMDGWW
jgi:hypothetical protein